MLEPGMNAYQQIAKPGQSSSLLLDQIGSPANNDANPDLEVTSLVEHSQITSGPELIGDDSRIPRIAFSLSASGSLTSSIYSQSRYVHELKAGSRQHRLEKTGDTSEHIKSNSDRSIENVQIIHETLDCRGIIGNSPVDKHTATLVYCGGPMDGDSYDNALAQTVNGLFKTELIRRRGASRSLEHVELATAEWIDWWHTTPLHSAIGDVPRLNAKQPTIATAA